MILVALAYGLKPVPFMLKPVPFKLSHHRLLVSQCFGGQNARGGRRGIECGEERDADRDHGDDEAIEQAWGEGQGIDGVDVRREGDAVVAAGP